MKKGGGVGGAWNVGMEGRDMPAGQPCDVFATCQNMCAYVFCRRRRAGGTLRPVCTF